MQIRNEFENLAGRPPCILAMMTVSRKEVQLANNLELLPSLSLSLSFPFCMTGSQPGGQVSIILSQVGITFG